ncbi:MAG: cytochrome c oxidase subunit [Pseudomonadota bacterium]|jgi:cytochrome c oxidase subunit 2
MKFGQNARAAGRTIKALGVALALLAAPQAAFAQDAATAASPAASAAAAPEAAASAAPAAASAAASAAAAPAAAPAVDPNDPRFKIAEGGYTPMVPTAGKGMPVDKGIHLQDQYSDNGLYARWMHDAILMPVIVAISLLVLFLLLFIIARYNRRANPVASKTSHNTLLEVIWTGVPVLILVAIAVPSITLIAKQFKPAPAKALTIKVTGNQWYWTYTYVDNGGFEVISNMLKDSNEVKPGERARTDADGPSKLAVDYRMVVPVGEPIRMEVTAADVIHSFAVPSLWFKIDGVPGRINEKVMFIKEPGVYFGQCSELCGVRHGYMPIAIEALPRDKYNAWVMTQSGGKIDGMPEAPAAAAAPASAAPAAAAPASPAPAA